MFASTVMIAALVASSAAQAARRATRTRATDGPDRQRSARGARLTVDNFAGEVVVKTWDRDSCGSRRATPSRAKVNIRHDRRRSSRSARTPSSHAGSVDYEITAPAWMPVKVAGTYNFITVEGAQSEVSAETTRGDIDHQGRHRHGHGEVDRG